MNTLSAIPALSHCSETAELIPVKHDANSSTNGKALLHAESVGVLISTMMIETNNKKFGLQ